MPYTFLTPAARSGKSSLAVRLAPAVGGQVVAVATAEARDDDMAERIRAYRASRPEGWRTMEAPIELIDAVDGVGEDACVVLDCLTLWVSNAIEAGAPEEQIDAEARTLASDPGRAPRLVRGREQRGGARHRAGERPGLTYVETCAQARERVVRRPGVAIALRGRRPRPAARGGDADVNRGDLLETDDLNHRSDR